MIIEIRGITYPSVRNASETLGIAMDAIYSALKRGSMDAVGLGNTQRQPINLDGLNFPSLGAASKALGFNRSFVRYAIATNSAVAKARLEQAINRYKQNKEMCG
jgi:hypothetical protein